MIKAPLALALVTLATIWGCEETSPETLEVLEPGVTYAFVWDDQGVVSLGDGGWSTSTDLGYEVTIWRSALSMSTVQLVPCDETVAHRAAPWSRALDWLLAATPAHAGHGDSPVDPSAVLDGALETVAPGAQVRLGPGLLGTHRYCTLHTLFGPSLFPADTVEVDMALKVLFLEGEWRSPSGASGPLLVHTDLPNGAMVDLEDESGAAAVIEVDEAAVVVEVERRLADLFDGLELETVSDDTRDRAILTSLVGSVQARRRGTGR